MPLGRTRALSSTSLYFLPPTYCKVRALSWPIFGCSPRPRKRPGGSTRKLPSFSLRPSTTAKANGSSRRSLSACE